MSPLPIAAVAAMMMTAAVAAVARGVRPRRRSLAQVRSLLYPTESISFATQPAQNRTSPGITRSLPGAFSGAAGPLARRIENTVGDGLRFVDMTATDVASRILVAVVGSIFVVACAAASLITIGALPPSRLWILAAMVVGAMAGWIIWSDVYGRVERRRREFRRTTTDFVQLVAVGLTTDQSVEEAIQFALSVGDSDMFELLRTELATAPLRGVPLWEALDQLGRRYQQRELSEFGASIERQGTQGVSITETVTTLATAMRERSLDDLEREADKVNANLAGPTICFVVTTVVFLAYPLAIRIGQAFGG
jgi:Flp pilus assembly protein TadB